MQALRGAQQTSCSCSKQQQRSAATSRTVRLLAKATSQPNQQQQQPSFASTAALTAAAAATVLQLCLPAAPALAQVAAAYSSSNTTAVSAAAWQPVLGDVAAVAQLPADQEDFATEILTEELALPPQLMDFMELLQKVRSFVCVCYTWRPGISSRTGVSYGPDDEQQEKQPKKQQQQQQHLHRRVRNACSVLSLGVCIGICVCAVPHSSREGSDSSCTIAGVYDNILGLA